MKNTVTVEQAANHLEVTRQMVYAIISDGFIKADRNADGVKVLDMVDVKRYDKYRRLPVHERRKMRGELKEVKNVRNNRSR